MTEKPNIVIYGALSKAEKNAQLTVEDQNDPRNTSIETQVNAVMEELRRKYPNGFEVFGPKGRDRYWFEDNGFSGSKRNRGPELQEAIEEASRVAAERGACELWANTSARFGRGTSRPGEARAIGELFYELRKQNVVLHTVVDDQMVSNEMLVGIGSYIAAKYSEDLGESVKRAKLREFKTGKRPGGPVPDGYTTKEVIGSDDKSVKEVVLDPVREPVVRTIFQLSEGGMPDTQIARRMNDDGFRTKNGRPYTRSSIWATLSNPFYAGRVSMKPKDGERMVKDGKHPALVDPSTFDKIQAARTARDYAKPTEKAVGRPNENHVLARLGVCGQCGGRLFAKTSPYIRKDGTKKRSYSCQNAHLGTGLCDASPIDASVVDQAVIAALPDLFPDFDRWRDSVTAAHDTERDRLLGELDRATADFKKVENTLTKVEAQWTEFVESGDTDSASTVLPIVKKHRKSVTQAKSRLKATQDALKSLTDDPPTNTMLDFANSLQAALRGRLESSGGSIREINQMLRELFVEFRIQRVPDAWQLGDDDADLIYDSEKEMEFHKSRRVVVIQPFAKGGVFHWPYWLSEVSEPPPIKWLSPIGISDPKGNLGTNMRTA